VKTCFISFYKVFTETLDPISFQSNRELRNQGRINFEGSYLGHTAINFSIISYFKALTSRIFQVKADSWGACEYITVSGIPNLQN